MAPRTPALEVKSDVIAGEPRDIRGVHRGREARPRLRAAVPVLPSLLVSCLFPACLLFVFDSLADFSTVTLLKYQISGPIYYYTVGHCSKHTCFS